MVMKMVMVMTKHMSLVIRMEVSFFSTIFAENLYMLINHDTSMCVVMQVMEDHAFT